VVGVSDTPRPLGARRTEHDAVDGAAVSVETPERHTDEEIAVAAFAYDDEVGDVELAFGSAVRIGVTLSPTAARQLADRLADAADAADADA
jgi:hypothetical protein